MHWKSVTPVLLAALVIPVVAHAAKLPPLATMKFGENQTTYIFDPNKVTAVALSYGLSVTLKPEDILTPEELFSRLKVRKT